MFLRCTRRRKDGKLHEYWNVVENRQLSDGRVAQRQVLYLGEINANQREAWRKTVEVQEQRTRRQVALFPAGSMPADDVDAIGVCLSELRLARPRQWGAKRRAYQPRGVGGALYRQRTLTKFLRRGYNQTSLMGMIWWCTRDFLPRPVVWPTCTQLAAL